MSKKEIIEINPEVYNALREYDIEALSNLIQEDHPLFGEFKAIIRQKDLDVFVKAVCGNSLKHEERGGMIRNLSRLIRKRDSESIKAFIDTRCQERDLLNGHHWYPFPLNIEEVSWINGVLGRILVHTKNPKQIRRTDLKNKKKQIKEDQKLNIKARKAKAEIDSIPGPRDLKWAKAMHEKYLHFGKKIMKAADSEALYECKRLIEEEKVRVESERLHKEAASKDRKIKKLRDEYERLQTEKPLAKAKGIVALLKSYSSIASEVIDEKTVQSAIKRVNELEARERLKQEAKANMENERLLEKIRTERSIRFRNAARMEMVGERVHVTLEPYLHPAIPRDDMRYILNRIVKKAKIISSEISETPDGISFFCAKSRTKEMHDFIKEKLEEIDAAKNQPLSPSSTQKALGINQKERRELMSEGHITSAGMVNVKNSYLHNMTFHVHHPAEIARLIENGFIEKWRKERSEKTTANRAEGRFKAAITREENSKIIEANHKLFEQISEEEWNSILPGEPFQKLPKPKLTSGHVLLKEEAVRLVKSSIHSLYGPLIKQRQRERIGIGDIRLLHLNEPRPARRIIALLGPTNSGKTHYGIEKLINAKTGAYLAPLRLMALENHEVLKDKNISCSLVTGEERKTSSHDTHISCTIETYDINAHYDVVLIDEIQMISDEGRGWAWSRALACASADLIIVAGSEDAEPFIRRIAELNGDSLEIISFERRNSLEVENKPVKWADIRKGDAIIAFTRENVLDLKNMAEAHGHKAAVIYGALGPEARSKQAQLFRTGECDILVATDAVGMGLNLPIDRVIFSTISKYDGKCRRELKPSEVRQIAGRAGRFSQTTPGKVGMMINGNLHALISNTSLGDENAPLPIKPGWPLVERVMESFNVGLEEALDIISEALSDHHAIRYQTSDEELRVLWLTRKSGLSPKQRFAYLGVPLNLENEDHLDRFRSWMLGIKTGRANSCPDLTSFPESSTSSETLKTLENEVQAISAYLWLHNRFPDSYPDSEKAMERRTKGTEIITEILSQKKIKRRKLSPRYEL